MKINLFKNCIPVSGYIRGIIYDLQRSDYMLIPKELVSLVSGVNATKDIDNSVLEFWFSHLKENSMINPVDDDELDLFPSIDMQWDYPAHITNCILDIGELDYEKIKDTILKVNALGCIDFQIRIIDAIEKNEFEGLVQILNDSSIKSTTIYIKYSPSFNTEWLKKIASTNKNIQSIILYEAKRPETIREDFMGSIYLTDKKITDDNIISPNNFFVNTPLFTESKSFNTYLNRKIYIGSNGQIKNAPELPDVFGNISDTKSKEELIKLIESNDYQKFWKVKKDDIDVCKDCEFRYMCVDNRIPVQRKNGSWYHKSECRYNPYIAKWKEEEKYYNLQDSGVAVTEDSFRRDDNKIANLNSEIWGE